VNKPVGDNARKGAVKKRSQVKTKQGGASAWTKRDRASGEFLAMKRPAGSKGRPRIQERPSRENGRKALGKCRHAALLFQCVPRQA
jgi:hypothetical protein